MADRHSVAHAGPVSNGNGRVWASGCTYCSRSDALDASMAHSLARFHATMLWTEMAQLRNGSKKKTGGGEME